MGTISRTYNFTNGTVADADQVDTDFNTVYNEFNGNIENANIKAGAAIETSKLELAAGATVGIDLNGNKIDLDADADTSITADTDDTIDIEIAGADDFQFTANTFTSLSGSTIATNTIAETTAASGVTVDSLLIKDGGFVAAGAIDANAQEFILDADADTSITADTDDQIDIKISGADDFQLVANVFRALSGSSIQTNTIAETTAASGVTIDSLLIKDGKLATNDSVVNANITDGAVTQSEAPTLVKGASNNYLIQIGSGSIGTDNSPGYYFDDITLSTAYASGSYFVSIMGTEARYDYRVPTRNTTDFRVRSDVIGSHAFIWMTVGVV